jgi:hypothetical protein
VLTVIFFKIPSIQFYSGRWSPYTRWFKYDWDWFVLIYTQIRPGHIWITLYNWNLITIVRAPPPFFRKLSFIFFGIPMKVPVLGSRIFIVIEHRPMTDWILNTEYEVLRKFANSPPCAFRGSSGHKPQYVLMTLTYQRFTAVLLLKYGSPFLSGVYYCLSVFVVFRR